MKETYFAPANRSALKKVKKEAELVNTTPNFLTAFNAINNWVIILNENRQIVSANTTCLRDLKIDNIDEILGKRVGEALNCVHKNDHENGCGTSRFCQFCGAVQSMTESIKTGANTQECRITTKDGSHFSALDLQVTSTPIQLQDSHLTIFNVQNIADEKRRFLFDKFIGTHLFSKDNDDDFDLLKDAQELRASVDFLSYLSPTTKNLFHTAKMKLLLLDAEQGNLVAHYKVINLGKEISKIVEKFQTLPVSENKIVHFTQPANEYEIETDPILLEVALSIMLENALETGTSTVTIRYEADQENVTIIIHNKAFIDQDTFYHLFQRFSSTKSKERGMGTYLLRILADQYLNGRTFAETSKNDGTHFYLTLPI